MIEVKINPDVYPTGSDLAVINAARRSFNKRSEWDRTPPEGIPTGASYRPKLKEKDKRLIEFLARGMTANDFNLFINKVMNTSEDYLFDFDSSYKKEVKDLLWQWRRTPTHDTPFNHCFISFECKAPIFVHRQLIKHEYLICSEFSRRYITDNIEFYTPEFWRKAAADKKQGSSNEPVDLVWGPEHFYEKPLAVYNRMIEAGVAPEQARMVLPLSTITEWTWSGTLGAFAKMCRERLNSDVQYETQLVARQVYDHLLHFYPVSAKALVEGVK